MAGRGRFIVVEGGEAVGKSTQARLLAERLDAVLTREPGGTAFGERARTLLLDPAIGRVEPLTELLLIAAARAQHVSEFIVPALEAGRDVVCDRFTGSTLAYQGYGRGLPLAQVTAACDLAAGDLVADVTVLIRLDPARAALRRHDVADRIESEDAAFHARVHAGFDTLADALGWVVVDGDAPPHEVARRIEAALDAGPDPREGAP